MWKSWKSKIVKFDFSKTSKSDKQEMIETQIFLGVLQIYYIICVLSGSVTFYVVCEWLALGVELHPLPGPTKIHTAHTAHTATHGAHGRHTATNIHTAVDTRRGTKP